MRNYLLIFFLIIATTLFSQDKKGKLENVETKIKKTSRIEDRAAGIHNASNIGLFFENRGKLYPRSITQGPSGEFPINSAKHYIYRVNQFVGIPGNVVQSRYTDNEEWEAANGYHNSDTARVAMSDDPNSWNEDLGWPVKNLNGENIILSDQDSYCVFNDSNNTVGIIGIQIAQTGYAFGTKFAKNILFFKYELTNTCNKKLENLYFGLYNDIDIGDASGGIAEYKDDRLDFIKEKNLLYFFDDGATTEWTDGKTGFFGVTLLKTPQVNGVELGITDMHYSLYDDDLDIDSIQYGILSSSESLYNSSLGNRYFHLGNNSNLHYDDPKTIPASGLDLVGYLSSGPYNLDVNDTLVFYTAFVAGDDYEELIKYTDVAKNAVEVNFNLPKPPTRPQLSASEGDFKTSLYWNDESELSFDEFSGYDFEGYRLYRSNDKGINWKLIADFDQINSIGKNTGLQYNYIDSTIVNGFEYWYSITAYDQGNDVVESLESPIGNTLDAINTVSVTPRSEAIGRQVVAINDITNLNTGNTNYELNAFVIDNDNLQNNEYKTTFNFIPRIEKGDLTTNISISITDSNDTKPYKYSIAFTSSNTFDLRNVTLNEDIRTGYNYPAGGRVLNISGDGLRISMLDNSTTESKYLPEDGDVITINYAMNVTRNNVEKLIKNRPHNLNQTQTTPDGVSLKLNPPNSIKSVSRIGGNDNIELTFVVEYPDSVLDKIYVISIDGSGTKSGNNYVLISVSGTQILSDTLFNEDNFNFDGITGTITFDGLPSNNNKFSVETIKPILPNIKDSFSFRVKGSEVDTKIIEENISKIRVVPNPYVASSLYEIEYGELRKEPLRQIQFINLPQECTIYIFTVDADLVKTINHNAPNGTEVWDLRSEGGREIAAGIYLYVVKTKTTEYKERFAVIK
ncbi:MAG: hypothetical protein IPM32_07910 [Ignavibacteriae bacterium]|nr:hypothetical protein [Ignavibacteriota bacterium]